MLFEVLIQVIVEALHISVYFLFGRYGRTIRAVLYGRIELMAQFVKPLVVVSEILIDCFSPYVLMEPQVLTYRTAMPVLGISCVFGKIIVLEPIGPGTWFRYFECHIDQKIWVIA